MLQLKIAKPVTIIGQEYKAGDSMTVNKTLIHREVSKISKGIQQMIDAGLIQEVSPDTYSVIGDVAVNSYGFIYAKGETFRAPKVFEYEDVIELPSWVDEGVQSGFFSVDDGVIHVSGVTVAPTSFSIQVGKTQQLTASVAPADAVDQSGVWSSSDEAIAKVSAAGLVTGVAIGSAKISFTSTDGAKVAVADVSITAAVVAVTSVAVGPTSPSVEVGKTVQLNANVSPAGATDKSGTWTSADTSIATVDQNGLVTGVAAGTSVITFTTTDGSKKGNRTVTVTAPAAA